MQDHLFWPIRGTSVQKITDLGAMSLDLLLTVAMGLPMHSKFAPKCPLEYGIQRERSWLTGQRSAWGNGGIALWDSTPVGCELFYKIQRDLEKSPFKSPYGHCPPRIRSLLAAWQPERRGGHVPLPLCSFFLDVVRV